MHWISYSLDILYAHKIIPEPPLECFENRRNRISILYREYKVAKNLCVSTKAEVYFDDCLVLSFSVSHKKRIHTATRKIMDPKKYYELVFWLCPDITVDDDMLTEDSVNL